MSISLPDSVVIPRKTKKDRVISLNLNVYRNLDYFTSNEAKKIYKAIISEKQITLNSDYPYTFIYTLWQKSNRKVDVANVLSIVDKFTCDALVELGLIQDDNFNYINEVRYIYGGVDKINPRVELTIKGANSNK